MRTEFSGEERERIRETISAELLDIVLSTRLSIFLDNGDEVRITLDDVVVNYSIDKIRIVSELDPLAPRSSFDRYRPRWARGRRVDPAELAE